MCPQKSTNTNIELEKRKNAAVPRGIAVLCDFYAERALNGEMWDIENRRFIDFSAGIAVLNTGHRHPKITAAIEKQLKRFTHTAFQIAPYPEYIELAERINAATPGAYAKKTAFFTTGAEAVENAIKIARAATGRSAVIAFSGAFHGRTMMGMALTGKVSPYKIGFGPLPSEVYHVQFPSMMHGITSEMSLRALESLFKTDIDPKRVAALIIEPIQGEGGFYVAPQEFMRSLRSLCDEQGIVLIADEIQTGFARTGKMFAMEHYSITPYITTMAKSIAGGMPLSAVCGRVDIMDAPIPGGLGGTYAGNPLAIASALAVLDIVEKEKLLDRANRLGKALVEKLESLRSKIPQIADIRGLGAMIAVEFTKPGTSEPVIPPFLTALKSRVMDGFDVFAVLCTLWAITACGFVHKYTVIMCPSQDLT